MQNRSLPASTVIPLLSYPDVDAASRWLREALGFELRPTIGNHRIQLAFGDGAIVLTEFKGGEQIPTGCPFAIMVRVQNVDAHHDRAARHGGEAWTRLAPMIPSYRFQPPFQVSVWNGLVKYH